MTIKIADAQIYEDVIELKEIKKDIKKLEHRYDFLKKHIICAMNDAEILANEDGEYLCTYSPTSTFVKIDLEQIAFHEPKLYTRLLKEYGAPSKSFKAFRLIK